RHGVHGDAFLHHFLRQRLGEAVHARLRGGVVGLAELALERVHRRDVDDAAPAALHHPLDHLARDVEHAVEVGVDHRYQSDGDMRWNTPSRVIPALFTRISTGPTIDLIL